MQSIPGKITKKLLKLFGPDVSAWPDGKAASRGGRPNVQPPSSHSGTPLGRKPGRKGKFGDKGKGRK